MRIPSPLLSIASLALLTFILTFTTAIVGEGRANAEPTSAQRSQAAQLKRRADAAMDSLHYADALADYTAAYALTHDPALLYNRARVLEALERFAEAADELEKFSAEAPPEMRARVPKLKELIADLNARLARLVVRCPVAGARIIVRDKVVATTPLSGPIRLNAGPAELEVAADGYLSFRKTIDLPKAGELTVDVTLVAREAKGQLVVASIPDGADVTVDGKPLGRAPTEAELLVGNHEVVVSMTGFRDKTASAVVVEGERRRVEISLEQSPPITKTWWFWTGVGAVVLGATVATLTVALTTERSAGQGDIPPGQVAGPLRF